MNPGPPDYNTSALNHSAALKPQYTFLPMSRISDFLFGSIYQAESKEYAKYHKNPMQTRMANRLDLKRTPNLRGAMVTFPKK